MLALLIGALAHRSWLGACHHALVGLIIGLIFGSVVLVLSSWPAVPRTTAAVLLPWIINELLFPVGCALILYRVRDLTGADRQGTGVSQRLTTT